MIPAAHQDLCSHKWKGIRNINGFEETIYYIYPYTYLCGFRVLQVSGILGIIQVYLAWSKKKI